MAYNPMETIYNLIHMKNLPYKLISQKIFSEPIPLVIFKVLLFILIYLFVLEPITISNLDLISSNIRTDENSFFFHIFILIFAILTGYLIAITKQSLFITLDLVLVATLLLVTTNNHSDYQLLPNSSNIKYIYYLFLTPLFSILWFWHFNSSSNINIETDIETGFIIPDLQLSDLAAFRNEDIIDIDNRLLRYGFFAKNISETIKTIKPHKAFTIGISGEWGSGKSSLIDLVRNDLKDSDITIIDFNPWLYPDEKSLIVNFFKVLKLNTSDLFLYLAFEEYAKLATEISIQGIKFDLPNLLQFDNSVSKIKTRIHDKLKTQKMKFLVVIDDIDRLDKNEILEISKLSRIIADFPNIVYLLSYSRTYIDSILKSEGENASEKYFDKIVQMEFKVPPINEAKISQYLKLELETQLAKIGLVPNSEYPINKLFRLNIYQNYLPTIRDVKRFLNAFLIKYKVVHNKVDFYTFFLLELFFYKHKESFNRFYLNRAFFFLDIKNLIASNKWVDEENSKYMFRYLGINEKLNETKSNLIDISVLNEIFINNQQISFEFNINQYFILSGFDQLDYSLFKRWIEGDDIDETKKILESWLKKTFLDDVLISFNKYIDEKANPENTKDILISPKNSKEYFLDNVNQKIKLIHESILKTLPINSDIKETKEITSKFTKLLSSIIVTLITKHGGVDIIENIIKESYKLELISSNLDDFENIISRFNHSVIVSDEKTRFTKSTHYMFKSGGQNAVGAVLSKTWTSNSNKIEQLSDCNWITRNKRLNNSECDKESHTFTFERTFFSITDSKNIESALLYVLADDEVEIEVNNHVVGKKIGFDVDNNKTLQTPINIIDFIIKKENIITFNVKNHTLEHIGYSGDELLDIRNKNEQARHNPYGLIFKLIIEPIKNKLENESD